MFIWIDSGSPSLREGAGGWAAYTPRTPLPALKLRWSARLASASDIRAQHQATRTHLLSSNRPHAQPRLNPRAMRTQYQRPRTDPLPTAADARCARRFHQQHHRQHGRGLQHHRRRRRIRCSQRHARPVQARTLPGQLGRLRLGPRFARGTTATRSLILVMPRCSLRVREADQRRLPARSATGAAHPGRSAAAQAHDIERPRPEQQGNHGRQDDKSAPHLFTLSTHDRGVASLLPAIQTRYTPPPPTPPPRPAA
jgi:hypothetical protein